MDKRFTILGAVIAILAAVGLVLKSIFLLHGISVVVPIAFLVVGFILFGYGLNGRSLLLDLGAALVVIAIMISARSSFLWLVLALGSGVVAYAITARTKTHAG